MNILIIQVMVFFIGITGSLLSDLFNIPFVAILHPLSLFVVWSLVEVKANQISRIVTYILIVISTCLIASSIYFIYKQGDVLTRILFICFSLSLLHFILGDKNITFKKSFKPLGYRLLGVLYLIVSSIGWVVATPIILFRIIRDVVAVLTKKAPYVFIKKSFTVDFYYMSYMTLEAAIWMITKGKYD